MSGTLPAAVVLCNRCQHSLPTYAVLLDEWYTAPSPHDTDYLAAQLDTLDIGIKRHEDEIARLSRLLDEVRRRKEKLAQDTVRLRTFVSCRINRLPTPILSSILALTYPERRFATSVNDFAYYPFSSPSSFSAPFVCRFWRKACLSTGLCLGMDMTSTSLPPEFVRQHVSGSELHSVSIQSCYPFSAPVEALLRNQASCWGTARVFITDAYATNGHGLEEGPILSALHTLELVNSHPNWRRAHRLLEYREFFESAPHLTRLFVDRFLSPHTFILSWSQITTLVVVVDRTLRDWLPAILACDLCTLALISHSGDEELSDGRALLALELPRLRTLSLRLPPRTTTVFLGLLVARYLTTFAFIPRRGMYAHIRDMVTRSVCTIRHVVFLGLRGDDDKAIMGDCLSALDDSVRTLEVLLVRDSWPMPWGSVDNAKLDAMIGVTTLPSSGLNPLRDVHTFSLISRDGQEICSHVANQVLLNEYCPYRAVMPSLRSLRLSASREDLGEECLKVVDSNGCNGVQSAEGAPPIPEIDVYLQCCFFPARALLTESRIVHGAFVNNVISLIYTSAVAQRQSNWSCHSESPLPSLSGPLTDLLFIGVRCCRLFANSSATLSLNISVSLTPSGNGLRGVFFGPSSSTVALVVVLYTGWPSNAIIAVPIVFQLQARGAPKKTPRIFTSNACANSVAVTSAPGFLAAMEALRYSQRQTQ
ncbi:hypothetical protein FISHEDRAFT_56625 [Fistulina hepatica ATCC 64428]|uniref:F-box domain-containing protein n=1 Tax=Fistulina hepatica ATCC 64428 TaxID=1128425 RepID=A0A0D7AL12_9AGAR|nr:hypothetical protein FISHEDRAFT_56625 [Fistulina hepatica ATCC 64428]